MFLAAGRIKHVFSATQKSLPHFAEQFLDVRQRSCPISTCDCRPRCSPPKGRAGADESGKVSESERGVSLAGPSSGCLSLAADGRRASRQFSERPIPAPGSVTITGPWQFHTSDDMAWANPTLDDSHWEQIKGDDTWGAQTHPGHTGFAWYRKRIDITGADKSLAILIPPVDDAYELYWNGQKIGRYGELPPHAKWWGACHSAVYSLP